jgi:hypothetical protein
MNAPAIPTSATFSSPGTGDPLQSRAPGQWRCTLDALCLQSGAQDGLAALRKGFIEQSKLPWLFPNQFIEMLL